MKKKYLSKEKLEELKVELEEKKVKVRKKIADRLKKAKELGDLSENADYSDAKQKRSENERRIAEIEEIIHSSELVNGSNDRKKLYIGLGSKVLVEDDSGEKKTFSIVGSYDIDPDNNIISNESPLGRAFVDKKVGDDVEVETPSKIIKYKILNIE